MYKLISFEQEEHYIRDFLSIPKKLYTNRELIQNEKEERELLLGQHVLSKYFNLYKLLVYKGNEPVSRCIITIYPDDLSSYIGFFESIEDTECTRLLFEKAKDISRFNNCHKITGPVDVSFWIRYRLKTNNFHHKPYVSEPYNKDYYIDLFLDAGYHIMETYISNYYRKPPIHFNDQKSKERYRNFTSKGYTILSPSMKEYDSAIRTIYKLLMELYGKFPVFKQIQEEDFVQHFISYKYILDFSIVKIAYYNEEPVGFMIGMPDYGNMLYGNIGLKEYLMVLLKKIRCSNYVLLYMGVKPKHRGLGNAMVQTMLNIVKRRRASGIGSLIKEGKVTQGYVSDKIESRNTYVLLEYNLEN